MCLRVRCVDHNGVRVLNPADELPVTASLKIFSGDTEKQSPLRIGARLDKYRIQKRLGEGGFATVYSALVPNLRGAQNAIAAGVDEIVIVISASNAHNLANLNRTVDRSIADLDGIFSLAAEQGIRMIASIATAFGCPYQGDVPNADVLKLLNAYRSRGAEALILADTTGMATPGRIERSIKMVQDHSPETEIILHLHDNRGTAMANLLTAMMCGATTFDTSIAGLGGCPYVPKAAGNLPTEDVVYMLDDMGIETGINLEAMILAALQLEKILGKVLSGQVMKSGPRDPERAAELCGINH